MIEETKPDYYSVGTRSDIVISNSSLSYLEPEIGGSIQKFLSFFDKQAEKLESKGIENGKLIHLYAEKPNEFAVAKIPRPDGSIAAMADEFYRLKTNLQEAIKNNITESRPENLVDISFTSDLKTESGRSAEILDTKAAYKKLSELLQLPIEVVVGLFRLSRTNTDSYKSYKEKTLVDKFISECIDYLKQAEDLEGKLTLTVATKELVENCIASLRSNELANKFFGLGGSFDSNIIIKELDIYFELLGCKCKSRLDNIYVDLINKIIYINDLKTTSKPLALFQDTLEYYRYYRQLAFYKRALLKFIKNNHSDLKELGGGIDLNEFSIFCSIVAIETTGNFECQVFTLDESYITKGEEEIKKLINRYKFHKEQNIWNKSMESILGNGYITLTPKL